MMEDVKCLLQEKQMYPWNGTSWSVGISDAIKVAGIHLSPLPHGPPLKI